MRFAKLVQKFLYKLKTILGQSNPLVTKQIEEIVLETRNYVHCFRLNYNYITHLGSYIFILHNINVYCIFPISIVRFKVRFFDWG